LSQVQQVVTRVQPTLMLQGFLTTFGVETHTQEICWRGPLEQSKIGAP
jgi:hypothetical protein